MAKYLRTSVRGCISKLAYARSSPFLSFRVLCNRYARNRSVIPLELSSLNTHANSFDQTSAGFITWTHMFLWNTDIFCRYIRIKILAECRLRKHLLLSSSKALAEFTQTTFMHRLFRRWLSQGISEKGTEGLKKDHQAHHWLKFYHSFPPSLYAHWD